MQNELLTTFSLFFSTSVLVLVLIAVVWYLLEGIGLYKIAKENNIDKAWLAWIPFGQSFLLGKITGGRVWKLGFSPWILMIGQIIIMIVPIFIPLTLMNLLIYFIIAFIYYCYFQSALNKLYKMQDPDKSFLYLFLGFLFVFLVPVWIFVLRNKREPYYKNYHPEDQY